MVPRWIHFLCATTGTLPAFGSEVLSCASQLSRLDCDMGIVAAGKQYCCSTANCCSSGCCPPNPCSLQQDLFQLSAPRARCIQMSIWTPFLYGQPLPDLRAWTKGTGCRRGSKPGRQKCRLEVRQVTEAEAEGPSCPFPGSPAPPFRGVGSVGGNAPTEPGQNFPGPLGALWCLFTLKREGGKKEGKKKWELLRLLRENGPASGQTGREHPHFLRCLVQGPRKGRVGRGSGASKSRKCQREGKPFHRRDRSRVGAGKKRKLNLGVVGTQPACEAAEPSREAKTGKEMLGWRVKAGQEGRQGDSPA